MRTDRFSARAYLAVLPLLLLTALSAQQPLDVPARPLLVLGYMGGRVKADNFIHQEAVMARSLQQRNGGRVKVLMFANHDGMQAFDAVLNFVDTDHDGKMSPAEKQAARIVIYGHSWGASEAVQTARLLNKLGVPVLLTIQVDSVQKLGENDSSIPPNVHQAMNFYQTEGMLRGRVKIIAADPAKTVILGNRELTYKTSPVDCSKFPWFARTFMKQHIEIENDPRVWQEVEAMIQQEAENKTVTP